MLAAAQEGGKKSVVRSKGPMLLLSSPGGRGDRAELEGGALRADLSAGLGERQQAHVREGEKCERK